MRIYSWFSQIHSLPISTGENAGKVLQDLVGQAGQAACLIQHASLTGRIRRRPGMIGGYCQFT
jgi:hypothetical protein